MSAANMLDITNSMTKTMSSREIAELTGGSHDNVLKTVRGLIKRGVVSGNETPYTHSQNGQTYKEILLDYRNTMVVVSGYSPELRAKIIDRWIELEAAPSFKAPTTMREALMLALDQQEEIERQKALIDAAAPKVAALEELAGMDGVFGLREAAKECSWPEGKFIQRLHEMRWIFKQEPNRPWQAHADKLRDGLLAHKTYEQTKPNGEVSLRYQVVVTAKGLTRLAVRLGPVAEGKRAVPFAKKPEPAS